MGTLQLDDGGREVVVASAPHVDELRVGQTESVGDLRRADQIVGIDLPSHRGDARRTGVDAPPSRATL